MRLMSAILLSLLFCAQAWAFTDDSGTDIPEQAFQRIISLYPAHTENLLALGAKQLLAGVSRTETDNSTTTLPVFTPRDGIERFLAAKPDLVLIRPMHRRAHPMLWDTLEKHGITVAALQPTTPEAMYEYWQRLGILSGKGPQATAMITDFRAQLETLAAANNRIPEAGKPRVFLESIHRKMSTFSPESIAMFALSHAGGVNAVPDAIPRHDTNIASCGKEKLLSHAREIDFYIAQNGHMNPIRKEDITEDPALRLIPAVAKGRVFLLDEALISRPTPRIMDGILEMKKILDSAPPFPKD